jgi:hypothetical protein
VVLKRLLEVDIMWRPYSNKPSKGILEKMSVFEDEKDLDDGKFEAKKET